MMISYDDFWEYFLDNTGVHVEEIPQEEDNIKKEIRLAISKFNLHLDCDLSRLYNDVDSEEINMGDNDNDSYDLIMEILMLITECHLEEVSLSLFQSTWQFDEKEVKTKFYKDQVSARNEKIYNIRAKIGQLISYERDGDFNS